MTLNTDLPSPYLCTSTGNYYTLCEKQMQTYTRITTNDNNNKNANDNNEKIPKEICVNNVQYCLEGKYRSEKKSIRLNLNNNNNCNNNNNNNNSSCKSNRCCCCCCTTTKSIDYLCLITKLYTALTNSKPFDLDLLCTKDSSAVMQFFRSISDVDLPTNDSNCQLLIAIAAAIYEIVSPITEKLSLLSSNASNNCYNSNSDSYLCQKLESLLTRNLTRHDCRMIESEMKELFNAILYGNENLCRIMSFQDFLLLLSQYYMAKQQLSDFHQNNYYYNKYHKRYSSYNNANYTCHNRPIRPSTDNNNNNNNNCNNNNYNNTMSNIKRLWKEPDRPEKPIKTQEVCKDTSRPTVGVGIRDNKEKDKDIQETCNNLHKKPLKIPVTSNPTIRIKEAHIDPRCLPTPCPDNSNGNNPDLICPNLKCTDINADKLRPSQQLAQSYTSVKVNNLHNNDKKKELTTEIIEQKKPCNVRIINQIKQEELKKKSTLSQITNENKHIDTSGTTSASGSGSGCGCSTRMQKNNYGSKMQKTPPKASEISLECIPIISDCGGGDNGGGGGNGDNDGGTDPNIVDCIPTDQIDFSTIPRICKQSEEPRIIDRYNADEKDNECSCDD